MLRKSVINEFDVVWIEDPAFDKDNESWDSAWAEYVKSGSASALPCHAGESPTVFRCRPLGTKAMMRATKEQGDDNIASAYTAVRYGLREIRNYLIDDKEFTLGKQHFEGTGPDERLTDAAMESLWDISMAIFLGSPILERSILDPSRGRD